MKKVLLLIAAVVNCSVLWSTPRSEQQALELAKQAFARSSGMQHMPSMQQPLWSHSWTAELDGAPTMYVFNRGEDDGFVIISADDVTPDVLGYSDSGSFDEQQLPDNMRAWLDGYSRAIRHAVTVNQQPRRAQMSYTPIQPICTTLWNQDAPYNQKCPMYGNKRCPTGCAATAMAQIMKAHEYPTQGTGSHSYLWNGADGTTQTLSADFAGTTYAWASMKDDYRSSSTSGQKNAVATLMYHLGVASEMEYGPDESGAYADEMLMGLIQYFDYDMGIRAMLKDYMLESDFMEELISDLSVGQPVFLSGYTPNLSGHAFVCDGLDANGLLHINWGWGGLSNGYFVLSVLNPYQQGIGGSPTNDSYTEGVTAYTHIRPNANGLPVHTLVAEDLLIGNMRVARNDMVRFYADTLSNCGVFPWAGTEALLVYQNDSLVHVATGQDNLSLGSREYYETRIPFYGTLASLPAGQYEVVPAFTVADQSNTYAPLYVLNFGICRCPITVTTDSIFLSFPDIDVPVNPNPEPTPLQYDAEVDFAENFPTYDVDASNLYSDGYAYVSATNDSNAYISLIFLVGMGVNEIPADTYQIEANMAVGKVYAGQGIDSEGYIVGSFAAYLNARGGITTPLWFLVDGSVTLDASGIITVNATNSYGKTITCTLGDIQNAVSHTTDEPTSPAASKILRNGQLYIRRDGITYTIQGLRMNN